MKKLPLNQKGLQRMQSSLYNLPDKQLLREILAIRLNFKHWITTKFEINEAELEYLNHLDENFIKNAAVKFSNFLAARTPVYYMVFKHDTHSILN